MEAALADLDCRLIAGEDPRRAHQEVSSGFMYWTRQSVAQFSPSPLVTSDPPSDEMRHWEQEAAQTALYEDPDLLDRFLRIWLAVIHEAAASGLATLYALPAE